MANEPFADNQDKSKISYRPSAFKFTDPIRFFKANDPYYWEVDNIALDQLQNNVLWLKDQVGSDAAVDGITRDDFNELRPTVTGDDRSVSVSPGKFMGRVNDAFGTGITSMVRQALANIENSEVKSEVDFTITDTLLDVLVGEVTNSPTFNNGLYDHIQHHVSTPTSTGTFTVDWGALQTVFDQNSKTGIANIPKIKLALWKQATTAITYGDTQADLQQLAVEFTRCWGAPFRTALVNVKDTLSISVPPFDENDFTNDSNYIPGARVDLLFVYTKPVDASSTVIAKASGENPVKITSPQLGLVRGAGVVSLAGKGPGWEGQSVDAAFLDSDTYQENKANSNNYFEASASVDTNGNTQIGAPIADIAQSVVGLNNVYGNFPSPDDLMNLAPYIAEGLATNNPALIGQSVLPLAYVFVKKGQSVITSDDIIDIRPFFRTAELTYNERSGVAAANPPLSLANPAVGRAELHKATKELRNFALSNNAGVPEYPRPVGGGVIFGGLKWGVEGSILRMAVHNGGETPVFDLNNISNQTELVSWFKDHAGLPPGATSIPSNPDWDIAKRTDTFSAPGLSRNDRINIALQSDQRLNYKFSGDETISAAYDSRVSQTLSHKFGNGNADGTGLLHAYVVKRINVDRSLVSWMTDYDVFAEYVNCVPTSSKDKHFNHSDNKNQQQFTGFTGLHVEKHYDHFYVIASFEIPDPIPGTSDVMDARFGSWGNRDNDQWSSFMVTHEAGRFLQSTGGTNTWSDTYKQNMAYSIATYPTVKFNIIGYPSSFSMNTTLGSDNNITLGS